MITAQLAERFLALHHAPELLTVVNVWDVESTRVVAEVPGTTALATASHSIAASQGYDDGENIPLDLMLDVVGRIVASTELPVSADLEAGYGDPGETIRRAIGLGVVGANIEDAMRPLADSVRAVEQVVAAAIAEGVPAFVLNARTDAFLRPQDRSPEETLREAITRGRAYLDAGASVVFVPGAVEESDIAALVDAFGDRRLTLIGRPNLPDTHRLEELGVARVSYGPAPQRAAMAALKDFAVERMAR